MDAPCNPVDWACAPQSGPVESRRRYFERSSVPVASASAESALGCARRQFRADWVRSGCANELSAIINLDSPLSFDPRRNPAIVILDRPRRQPEPRSGRRAPRFPSTRIAADRCRAEPCLGGRQPDDDYSGERGDTTMQLVIRETPAPVTVKRFRTPPSRSPGR